ncbi:MAG: TerC family protein [Methyloligellaceae bacterium]
MDWITDPQIWASLMTLTVMEIVLGIDNIIFISVVVARLPKRQAEVARRIGLTLALVFRIVLLLGITWIITMREPVIEVFGKSFSWRDLILLGGGLFLLAKATFEIHNDIEEEGPPTGLAAGVGFLTTIMQIIIIDMVFSVDSIITAVGMADHVEVMIAAVAISMIVMYFSSIAISDFIDKHPTTKMLALSFLFLIGAALIADGLQFHIPRGYIYFAISFAAMVEVINILARRKRRKTLSRGEQP